MNGKDVLGNLKGYRVYRVKKHNCAKSHTKTSYLFSQLTEINEAHITVTIYR